MFVGGEFYYDGRWITEKPTLTTEAMYFLNGGQACLSVICDDLLQHKQDHILLPSYLCPTIVKTLETCGMRFDFYQVNEDLSINLDDLSAKISGYPALYFINYFGFLHPPAALELIKSLQQKGVVVVEDNAQAVFTRSSTGDYIFNSLRKFAPYDGGYLITQNDVTPHLQKYAGRLNHRLPIIRDYRKRLYDYLFQDADDYEALDREFYLAERYYETDQVVLGDAQERDHIEHLDWPAIKQVRRDNYQYILRLIASIPEITPIFPELQPDNMPMGLPIYLSGVSRDKVNEMLSEYEISLTIHWEDLLLDPRINHNPTAVYMASRMLTLPVDQRICHKHLDHLVKVLKRAIKASKITYYSTAI